MNPYDTSKPAWISASTADVEFRTLAFGVSAGMFGAMALYGLVTKRDLTSWGSFFMMGLFGVFILMIAGFFIQTTALQMTIATLGIFVFLGLTAYDNQKLKRFATA